MSAEGKRGRSPKSSCEYKSKHKMCSRLRSVECKHHLNVIKDINGDENPIHDDYISHEPEK